MEFNVKKAQTARLNWIHKPQDLTPEILLHALVMGSIPPEQALSPRFQAIIQKN